jgi:hypothetical protein
MWEHGSTGAQDTFPDYCALLYSVFVFFFLFGDTNQSNYGLGGHTFPLTRANTVI